VRAIRTTTEWISIEMPFARITLDDAAINSAADNIFHAVVAMMRQSHCNPICHRVTITRSVISSHCLQSTLAYKYHTSGLLKVKQHIAVSAINQGACKLDFTSLRQFVPLPEFTFCGQFRIDNCTIAVSLLTPRQKQPIAYIIY
jgi:hypothetical protein